MILMFIISAQLLYGLGLLQAIRAKRRVFWSACLWYTLGLLSLAFALLGPLDDLADTSLSWHMVQHLIIISIAAPLLVLGAPLRLALRTLPLSTASAFVQVLNSTPLRALSQPAVAWVQFAIVLYVSHFSGLYEAALENETIHAIEHTIFLSSAILFWLPVLAVAPAPFAPRHHLRLLSVFMAIPMSAFLGFIYYVSGHVFYAHYAKQPNALADQIQAGAVMWIAGGAPLFVALLWLVADWGAHERRIGRVLPVTDGEPC